MSLQTFPNNPSLKSLEIAQLVLDKLDNGEKTWSLEFYDQVGEAAQSFKPNDTLYFVKQLINSFLDPSTNISCQFKITQLLSLLHSKSTMHFSESISPFKPQILKTLDQNSNHPINKAMKTHFNTIFDLKPCSSTPPPIVNPDFIQTLVPRKMKAVGPRVYSSSP